MGLERGCRNYGLFSNIIESSRVKIPTKQFIKHTLPLRDWCVLSNCMLNLISMEYASIILICILNSILFLGGYLFDFNYFLYPYFYLLQFIEGNSYMYLTDNESNFNVIDFDNYSTIIGTVIGGIVIGVKACMMIFTFIWARASFPRIRYDQLMSYCWTVLLPIVIAFIILVPCILYSFEILPVNVSLLTAPFVVNKDFFKKENTCEILPVNVPIVATTFVAKKTH